MSKKALIFGAGAIGRGFLGPLLSNFNFELSFVDKNLNLIKKMKSIDSYKAAIANGITKEEIEEATGLDEPKLN